MSNITGEESKERHQIGQCRSTDAWESRCQKIHLYKPGGKKIQRWGRRGRAERRGAGRLSNYPFKPNLRCCLKLTYANEVAKSHRGPQWLTRYRSKIGFHILSQNYQIQILSTTFTLFTQEQFFMWRGEVILVVCMEFFHLKCKAIMKRKPVGGVAGRIRQRLGTLIMTQRVNYFYNVHLHSTNSIATTKSFPVFTYNSNCFQSSFFFTSVKMLLVKLDKQNRADCSFKSEHVCQERESRHAWLCWRESMLS